MKAFYAFVRKVHMVSTIKFVNRDSEIAQKLI